MKKALSFMMIILIMLTLVPGEIALAVTEAAEEIEAVLTSEKAEEKEEVSTEAVPVEKAQTDEEFNDKVSELISENDTGEYFSQIVINQQENTSSIDGNTPTEAEEALVSGDVVNVKNDNAGIDIFSLLPESATQELSEAMEEKGDSAAESKYVPVTALEEQGYSITTNDKNEIVISNPYQTKRLIVKTQGKKALADTYGASRAICDSEGRYILQYDDTETAMNAHEKLREEKGISSVSPDHIVTVSQLTAKSSNPLTQNGRSRWGAERIESDRYKNYLSENNKSTPITVAVIDTGVDLDHPFIKDRLVPGYDFIDNDAVPDDKNMHGTHCSGIIKDNTPDNVKIMPVKVFNSDGRASDLSISLGIDYAVKNGADILNMSFGGDCSSESCEISLAIKRAVQSGVVCVAAAGNERENTANKCPAKLKECIVVSSVGVGDLFSSFSNFGDSVDISAPGEYIWSSTLDGKYEEASGTSMAAPFVASAVAMMLTDNPLLTNTEAEALLKNFAGDHGLKGKDRAFGVGVLDFGVFFGDCDPATSIFLTDSVQLYISEQITFSPVNIYPDIMPHEATNKAYTVKIADPAIADFDGFGFTGKKEGSTTAIFTLESGESVTVKITCEKRRFWIDKAADRFEGGSGTKYDPYLIRTPEQLARISYMGEKCLLTCDMYFKQIADIDLKEMTWYPVLARDEEKNVTRINYDGGGYEIKNLNISDIYGDIFIYYGGFFAVNQGEMKNIVMTDVDIDLPDSGVAPICVEFGGTMKNCYADGKVRGYGAGGLVTSLCNMMSLSYDTSIKSCRSDVTVKGGRTSGGICNSILNGTIANCIFTGKTEAPVYTGGIVALLSATDGITHESTMQYNNCVITNCISTEGIAGNVDGRFHEIGYNCASTKSDEFKFSDAVIPEISNCYYSGNVTAPIENADTEYVMSNIEKADISLFKTESFYLKESGNWNDAFPWSEENFRLFDSDFPKVKADLSADKEINAFDYHEHEDHITVTGYYGTDAHVAIPAYISGKPVTFIDFSFYSHNTDVLSIKIPDTVRLISSLAFLSKSGRISETLRKIDLGEGVQFIGKHAFYSCSNLKVITIPESVKFMDAFVFVYSGLENIFFECDGNNISRKFIFSDELEKKKVNVYYLKNTKGWDNFKSDDVNTTLSFYVYDKKIPAVVYGKNFDNSLIISYGERKKLQTEIFPEGASSDYITYKVSDNCISVDKYGTVAVNENKNASSLIYIYAKGRLVGQLNCSVLCTPVLYSVNYNSNGGKGKMAPLENISSEDYFFLSQNSFVPPEGKYFAGWALSADGKAVYTDRQEVHGLSSERGKAVTLYAVWETVKYNIRFKSNGGKGKMSTQKNVRYSGVTLKKNTFTPPKGKVFAGWALSESSQAVFTDGQKVKALSIYPNDTVTLYAVWVTPQSNKIIYDTNGGKLSKNAKTKYRTGTGHTLTEPTKKGYTFVGWYRNRDLKGEKIEKINPWDEGTFRLYARWKLTGYSVSFNANGGSGKMKKQTGFKYGKSKALKKNTFKAPKGKVFAGWATSKDGKAKYTDGQQVKNLTSTNGKTVKLYAVWVTPKAYKIKYNAKGGKFSKKVKKTYKSGTGTVLATPTRKGYKFVGWYTDKKCQKGKTTVIKPWTTGNKTFYAKWKKI